MIELPVTKRGIYHNLKESKYTVSNSEIVFFFSSEVYLHKFLDGYEENRLRFKKKFQESLDLNMNTLADITFYKATEKRGFRAWIKGVDMDWQEIQKYGLRKMTEQNTLNWSKIVKPKLGERRKIMV